MRIRTLGSTYLARLVAHAPEAEKLIDKTLSNFRLPGPIHLATPNARVIHMRRDPIDTCLSCFSKRFFGNLAWSYDLAELGRYYRAYEALMAHWRTALPKGFMIEVRYEDLVADLEGQARRVLAHVGLDWDPRCLDFHTTERTVRTASAAQVRRPIYRTSIERWRAYEARLGPLLAELRAPTAVCAGARPVYLSRNCRFFRMQPEAARAPLATKPSGFHAFSTPHFFHSFASRVRAQPACRPPMSVGKCVCRR